MGSLSLRSAAVRVPVGLIRAYQRVISPLRPPTCRFYPSCSSYAVTALERYGVGRGSVMAVRRLFRCHPFTAGGVDHVLLRDEVTGRPIPGTNGPRDFTAEPGSMASLIDQSAVPAPQTPHAHSGR